MQNFDLQEYRSILLETFKAFITMCEHHHLCYMGAYGTMLGAVRHHGMIPWDDDIDVFMPREDYEKFLALKNSESLGEYEISDIRDKGYHMTYAKFCNKNTTIWEHKRLPFILGVYVDVFPLDEVPTDSNKWKRFIKRYAQLAGRYELALTKFRLSKMAHWRHWDYYLRHLLFNPQKVKKQIILLEKEVQSIQDEKGMIASFPWKHGPFPKEIFTRSIQVPFEDFHINIPQGYDEFLCLRYGDWRTPPSVHERESTHGHYFVDLHRRWSIPEIEELGLDDLDYWK